MAVSKRREIDRQRGRQRSAIQTKLLTTRQPKGEVRRRGSRHGRLSGKDGMDGKSHSDPDHG